MNLNSRSSLDPRWVGHHVSVPVGFMLATVRVVRKTPNAPVVYDQNTGQYTAATTVVFEGKARVQPFGIMGDMVVGQDTTSRRLVRVQIETKTTGINVDDTLYVMTCPESPELVDFTFEVRGTLGSSNAWLTDLVCEADSKRG